MGDVGEDFKAFNEHKKEVRQQEEPNRMEYARRMLMGYSYTTNNKDRFVININIGRPAYGTVTFFPYTGWFQGQKPYGSIKGRGVHKLIKNLTERTK